MKEFNFSTKIQNNCPIPAKLLKNSLKFAIHHNLETIKTIKMGKKRLKIVFFGTPDFAVASLRAMVDAGIDVAAVVTGPDKPAGRGQSMRMSAVKEFALGRGLPVLQPEKLKDAAFITALQDINADLFVVIAFRMLPREVWAMPPLGTFNLHASLLPRYRGAAPINWAVINGDTRTGVTTFFLKQEIDTGDIIDRLEIGISPDDDAGTVHDRLMELGAQLTLSTIRRLEQGNLSATPQSHFSGEAPTPAPKIFKDTCHLDFNRPAAEVHNLVRGLAPYPGAWANLMAGETGQGTVKIFQTRLTDLESRKPGNIDVDHHKGTMTVDCADFRLEILSLQAPGKRRMPTPEFLRGCRLEKMSLK